jgi:hypothetical protein
MVFDWLGAASAAAADTELTEVSVVARNRLLFRM